MNKLVSLAIAAIWLTSPIAAKAVPVTWSFYETAITSCNGGAINGVPACVLPPQPFVLMTLTLPNSTSTGTATWLGTDPEPVYTGDSFTLTVPFTRPINAGFYRRCEQSRRTRLLQWQPHHDLRF